LSGKSFGTDAASAAIEFLQEAKDLQSVDIADIIAGRPEEEALKALEILTTVFKNTKPAKINVSDNALGKKGIIALRNLLDNQHNLQELYINNNGLDTAAAELIAELLLFQKPTKLRTVHCINNLLSNGGGTALATVFAESPDLESVIITATRIGSEGGLSLAKGLSGTKNLRHLDLSDNTFDEEGSQILANSLSDQPNLISLNLASTGLGDDGIEAIAKALEKTADKLEILNLSANEITEEGAKKLNKLLKGKHFLKQLKLEENELGNEGTKLIATALQEGHELLEEVDLSVNGIEDNGALAIGKALLDKVHLKILQLKDNDVSEDAQEELKTLYENKGRVEALRFEDEEEEEEPKKKKEESEEGIDDITQKLGTATLNK